MNAHENHVAWKDRMVAEIQRWNAEQLQAERNAYEVRELSTRDGVNTILGRTWCSKVRRHARKAGVLQAARNLRKQGVGLGVARLLLLGRL